MLELNRVYNEDCLDGLKKIDDGAVDLVVTDPPYLLEISGGGTSRLGRSVKGAHKELKENNLDMGFDAAILDELMRVMRKPNIYIWCSAKQIPLYLDYFVKERDCKFDILLWWKTNPPPLLNNKLLGDKEYCLYFRRGGYLKIANYEDGGTVYRSAMPVSDKERWGHPTIKPLPFIERMVRNSSKDDDIVLDPFMGSGTTAVAAVQQGRRYIGFEINAEYYKSAERRVGAAEGMRAMEEFMKGGCE